MKIGDPVRVRIPGSRRLVRGVVVDIINRTVRVTNGINSFVAPRAAVQVIFKRGERELVVARVRHLRQEVADLTRHRMGKILAR